MSSAMIYRADVHQYLVESWVMCMMRLAHLIGI
jgi:hypothetical protein